MRITKGNDGVASIVRERRTIRGDEIRLHRIDQLIVPKHLAAPVYRSGLDIRVDDIIVSMISEKEADVMMSWINNIIE